MENFENLSKKLIEKESSPSFKMDILMCKIRIAIITENRAMLILNVEKAQGILKVPAIGIEKNKLKVYLGLFYIMKAEFSELLCFEDLILYLVFSSLLTFFRSELKEKIINNVEVRKCSKFMLLPEPFYECKYKNFLNELLVFIEIVENDLFLIQFKEHFCKMMKIRVYNQLLLSYQSLHLVKMAQVFEVGIDSMEENLRNFINEGKLNCAIDRIDKVVRIKEAQEDHYLIESFISGEKILRNIKKFID